MGVAAIQVVAAIRVVVSQAADTVAAVFLAEAVQAADLVAEVVSVAAVVLWQRLKAATGASGADRKVLTVIPAPLADGRDSAAAPVHITVQEDLQAEAGHIHLVVIPAATAAAVLDTAGAIMARVAGGVVVFGADMAATSITAVFMEAYTGQELDLA